MQGWRVGSLEPVHVGVDHHLVVEPEDRVVERGAVEPHLDAVDTTQRAVEGQRVPDASAEGGLAELFFLAARGDLLADRVTEQEPNGGAVRGLLCHVADERRSLDQEQTRVDQYLDVLRRSADQPVPQRDRDRVPVRVDLHDFRLGYLSCALGWHRRGPEVGLALPHHCRDGVPVLRVGRTSLRDPALDRLRVDLDGCGDLVRRQPVPQERVS